jgi:hypothetical protein
MVRAIILITAAVAFASPAAAECKLYGGVGNGVTEGMAKFMAEAAVKNIIENKGLKPTGEIKHSCKAATVGSECVARQQGCK